MGQSAAAPPTTKLNGSLHGLRPAGTVPLLLIYNDKSGRIPLLGGHCKAPKPLGTRGLLICLIS